MIYIPRLSFRSLLVQVGFAGLAGYIAGEGPVWGMGVWALGFVVVTAWRNRRWFAGWGLW